MPELEPRWYRRRRGAGLLLLAFALAAFAAPLWYFRNSDHPLSGQDVVALCDIERFMLDRALATLAEAGLGADRIGTVFLTGGSSQLPILRATVQTALPGARLASGDMLGSLGTGPALDARRRFG